MKVLLSPERLQHDPSLRFVREQEEGIMSGFAGPRSVGAFNQAAHELQIARAVLARIDVGCSA